MADMHCNCEGGMTTIIDAGVLSQATTAWRDAPQGHKKTVVEKWAKIIGVSYQTLYRALPTSRERKGERQIEGIEETARIVAQFKNAPPELRGVITTEDAIKIALIN